MINIRNKYKKAALVFVFQVSFLFGMEKNRQQNIDQSSTLFAAKSTKDS
jgi:hypothetical protein